MLYSVQRQGRFSFYIQNQGEEATQIGIGKALQPEDHLFCQYRYEYVQGIGCIINERVYCPGYIRTIIKYPTVWVLVMPSVLAMRRELLSVSSERLLEYKIE
ncbi:mitochondrial branched-chain alpha-keto acid dehydrogenase E1, putative [Eimeria maxima]|uniref:2-oxoisovalerate dehydrogenase subunit alpha n=1 Tax=Eimeria maxima TaxID=5804 RepID=U6M796_EIMMA|nr:mitochondrial branched-chain alpha-keto acid dehydrogenase E1, putative [Eimeria maxima]CDJ58943.1 mitochondrial branched-chain alpha-keto acid dehydrogenase E1, putative [Eimeria maxima]